jgi:hypothetical protein
MQEVARIFPTKCAAHLLVKVLDRAVVRSLARAEAGASLRVYEESGHSGWI